MKKSELDEIILHDLKNPLSGITGTIGLFKDGLLGPLTEEQMKYICLIDISARELAGMIFDLQTVRKIEANNFELERSAFAVEELLEQIDWLKNLAGRDGKRLAVEAEKKLIVHGDQKILARVIENLLLNAIKQGERGEKISLSISAGKKEVAFAVFYSDGGVSREYLAHLFDRAFKADHPEFRAKSAAGVGFYFCKLAVEAHGGRIAAENVTVGKKGVKCSFYLPV